MNVVWVNRFGPRMASYRYRAQIPAEEVGKINGFNTAVNNGEADIVVFTKPFREDIDAAWKYKAEGCKIVSDLSDDHFQDTEAETYRKFVEVSDAIVCASTVMRGRIYDYVKRDSVVIGDPYEQAECEPHANGDEFLWFGHQRNLRELVAVKDFLGERKLRIVTGPKAHEKTIPWTLENMTKAFEMSNIVLLPTAPGNEFKSPNRLLNSIRAGCFPVCMAHPSYEEFKHVVWVGHFPTGLRWVDAFKDDLNGLVKQAQDYIRDRYSPAAIGRQWASFLESL